MKLRLISATLLLAVASVFASAQVDYIKELKEHPEYLDATDYLCPTGPVTLTPAPEGYEAFYLSHYGRHGARYAWQSDLYKKIHKLLDKAADEDNLTAQGKDWKERFDQLYPSVRYRTGDLSRKGWQQQKELAERMYANFPEIFPEGAHVRAWTSTSTRCVMTMSSFCLGLKGCNPGLDIFENFGKYFLPAILPLDESNPFREKDFKKTPVSYKETWEEYINRTIDYKPILGRLFKDIDAAVPEKEQWDLVSYLYFYAAGMNSLDTNLRFYDIFTPEERIALFKIDNFQFHYYAWETHLGYYPILRDIIAKADERIAAGEVGADLRFGHDYTILPLFMTVGVNGFGHDITDPDEIPAWCPAWDVPMGANIHFVFYRAEGKPTLFKVLLNGREATLPMPAVSGPYYDWATFKAQAYKPE